MKEEKIVEDLAEVLARTYKKINWRKIGVKNSHVRTIERVEQLREGVQPLESWEVKK